MKQLRKSQSELPKATVVGPEVLQLVPHEFPLPLFPQNKGLDNGTRSLMDLIYPGYSHLTVGETERDVLRLPSNCEYLRPVYPGHLCMPKLIA